jgi:hypothetical protein
MDLSPDSMPKFRSDKDPSKSKLLSPRRTIAEDKLQEKRLKERARRNGMAETIDEMRHCIPYLRHSTKAYSQAKVVAFALQHIHDLQADNDRLRAQFGLGTREEGGIPDLKSLRVSKKKRNSSPKARPTKRQRVDDIDDEEIEEESVDLESSVADTAPTAAVAVEEEEDEINVLATTPAAAQNVFPDGGVFPHDSMDSDEYVSESDSFSPTLTPANPFDTSNPFDSVGGRTFGTYDSIPAHISWGGSTNTPTQSTLLGYSPIDSFGLISGSPMLGKF